MPMVTRWFLRSGFLFLVLAIALGVAEAVTPEAAPLFVRLRPVGLHFLVVGWLTQLIFGVAYWLFPRHPTRPPRGSTPFAWAALVGLDLGLLARGIAEPMLPASWARGVLLGSALLHLAAVGSYAWLIWPRIRGR